MERLTAAYPADARRVHRVGNDHRRIVAEGDDHSVGFAANGTRPGHAYRVLFVEQVEQVRRHEAEFRAEPDANDIQFGGLGPIASYAESVEPGSSVESWRRSTGGRSGRCQASRVASWPDGGLPYGAVDLPAELRVHLEDGWIAPWLVRALIEHGHKNAVEQLAVAGDGYCVLVLAEDLAEHGDSERALAMIAPLAAGGLGGAVRAAGCLLDESGRVDEAIAMYQPALDASNLSAMDFVARMLARHGRVDEAFEMVLPHASDRFYAQLLVDISDGLGRDDEVMAVLDEYADSLAKSCDCGRRCGSWQAEELIAAVLERQGEIDSAISLLQGNVHRHNSTNINVVQNLADVLARHDRHDELRALIDGYGKEYAAHRFALHLESVGQVEGAITLLAPMAADGSRNPSSFLAGILVRAERTDEAIDVLTRALPRDPECLLWSWRELMVKHGRAEEALAVVDQLASGPYGLTERLYEARVCLLAVCGRGEQALQEVAARPADEWNAAEEVSYALSTVGQLDLAVKVLEPGFRDGDHQEPMALLLSQQGRIDDALAMLPRTADRNLYISPALRPKIQSW